MEGVGKCGRLESGNKATRAFYKLARPEGKAHHPFSDPFPRIEGGPGLGGTLFFPKASGRVLKKTAAIRQATSLLCAQDSPRPQSSTSTLIGVQPNRLSSASAATSMPGHFHSKRPTQRISHRIRNIG